MSQEVTVLCGSSSYTRKFYLNEEFAGLPEGIRDELKIMCVLFTADVGGTLQVVFDEEETDLLYDEIGSALKVKQLQNTKQELFEALELYYKVFFLGEELEED